MIRTSLKTGSKGQTGKGIENGKWDQICLESQGFLLDSPNVFPITTGY